LQVQLRNTSTAILSTLSILVAEELFLQDLYILLVLHEFLIFQSSLLRNSFCKQRYGVGFEINEDYFQSSLLRNSFCKEVKDMAKPESFISFQSSLLRNSFCKTIRIYLQILETLFQSSLLRNSFCKVDSLLLMLSSLVPFNPRC